jgi:hypothetical protein
MQKKVGFSRTGSVQADRLIINNGLTASTTYNFYGLTAISFNLPVVDGTNGQALKTDGAGNLSFGAVAVSSTSGTSGTSGQNGSSGTSGANGISGTSGTSGANGAAGANGTSGTSGANGVSGSSGTSGLTGTSGTSGANGAAGANGTSGTSGANGAAGVNGTSGTSGQSGSSGTSGLTGTSGTSGANGVGNATILGTTNYIGRYTGATALGTASMIESSGQIQFTDGSALTPSISFISDTNTGLFRASADNMQLVTNGVSRIVIGAGPINFASTSQVSFGQGSATTPSFVFTSDADTGIYSPASNQVGIAAGGEAIMFVTADSVNIVATASNNSIQFRTRNDGFVDYGMLNATNGLSILRYNSTGGFVDTALIIGKPEGDEGVEFRDGSAATPSISFQNDTDTGIYRPASNQLGFSTLGSVRMLIGQTSTLIYNQLQADDGSVSAPGISFRLDTDTGMYRPAVNQLGFSINGAIAGRFATNSGVASFTGEDGTVARPGIGFYADLDTGIYRPGTNQVAISAGGANAAVFGSTNSITNRTYFEEAVNHYPVVNASVSGTYTVDMSASNVFNLTLTGNTTLDYSNQSEGSYILLVKQDGTGGRSLSFTSGGKFIGATAVSIGTASNAKSIIQLIHIGTQSIVNYQTNLINL